MSRPKISDPEVAKNCASSVETILGENDIMQEQATMALSRLGVGVIESIIALFEDEMILENRRAVMAFVSILADFLDENTPRSYVEKITESLGSLLLEIEDNEDFALWHVADALVTLLGRDPMEQIHRDEALAQQCIGYIKRGIKASSPAGRKASLYAIVSSGLVEFTDTVRTMVSSDEDKTVRSMAVQALLNLEKGDRTIDLAFLADS